MAIIGEKLQGYVINQINARQSLHGSGAGVNSSNIRSDEQINLLNSNTSWIKLASGISISAERLREIDVDATYAGMGLAKRYILSSGISKLEQDGTDRLIQRQGFLPQDPNSSYTYGTYGYSPMPGIISSDIKTLNRGSLKKATVKIKVNNKQQFNIIDLLYLRLGYTVLLEWGNSLYTPDGVNREIVRNTLLENTFFNISGKGSYLDMLGPIEQYRSKYAGNYDGLLGKVSNFSWSFNEDGSYDIEITIISLGDVIESLKLNISTDQNLSNFILTSQGGGGGGSGDGKETDGTIPPTLDFTPVPSSTVATSPQFILVKGGHGAYWAKGNPYSHTPDPRISPGSGDNLHSFTSTVKAHPGRTMDIQVEKALKDFKANFGKPADIVGMSVKMYPNNTSWQVSWEVLIQESKDGIHRGVFTTNGSAKSPATSLTSTISQIDAKKSKKNFKKVYYFEKDIGSLLITQIFALYSA
jgi:hypothetical protein